MQITELIDSLKLEPLPRGARLMVLPFVQARHGFLIDTEENRENPESGIVLRVGPGGVSAETGRAIPVVSTVGEIVWFGKYAGLLTDCESPMGPIKVYLMQESEVLMARAGEGFEIEVHDNNPRKAHRKGLICDQCAAAPIDLTALQALAAGDVIDAEVTDEDEASPERAAETSTLIEEERKRLIAEREA